MEKFALIVMDEDEDLLNTSKLKSFFYKTKNFFKKVKHYKTHKVELAQEQLIIYILKIHGGYRMSENKIYSRLQKAFEWIENEGIAYISFDNYFIKNYQHAIMDLSNKVGCTICFGHNIFLPVVTKTLKKLLKSKGLEMSQTDIAILSNKEFEYEYNFIKKLSPYVKYLTYISDEVKAKDLTDNMFKNFGFSIRLCKDLKECIGEVDLLIDLTNTNVDYKKLEDNNNLIVFNANDKQITNKVNVTIINDIIIDISSKINIPICLNNEYIYKICEIYILSKLRKLHLLEQNATEFEFEEIWKEFKRENFKIVSLDAVNL